MAATSYAKILKQLENKPVKLNRFLKHSLPKERGQGRNSKKCQRCGRTGAHIGKYGLEVCRQCFREIATKIGFKQYS